MLRRPFDVGLLQLELPEALRNGDVKGAALVARTLSNLTPGASKIARLAARLEKGELTAAPYSDRLRPA